MIRVYECGVLFAFSVACAADVATDGKPSFDTDGDTISNGVEAEPVNERLYQFDTTLFDLNPSSARGCPGSDNPFCTGSLYSGINLPDQDRFTGYYHYYQPGDQLNTNDWGTLALINEVEATSRAWVDTRHECFYYRLRRASWSRTFGAGDLSQGSETSAPFMGGPWLDAAGFPRHESHQNGLDVDVRYLRQNGDQTPLDLAGPDSIFYDNDATLDLLYCFLLSGPVQRILIDTVYAKVSRGGYEDIIVHHTGHRNHFHVRITDPDGTNN